MRATSRAGHPLISAASIVSIFLTALSLQSARSIPTTLHVDGGNSNCSDQGAGTESVPFCTIGAAATVAAAGQTVLVQAGTYSEQVEVANSGSPGAPVVFSAAPGANVVVSGGQSGFLVSDLSWVTIRGFHVTDTTDHAIYLSDSSNITIEDNEISSAGEPIKDFTARGVYVSDTPNSTIVENIVHHNSDSGIYLVGSSTGVQIRNNVSYANARVHTRAAPGIDLRTGSNTVMGNITYSNEDSGIQIYSGARNNLIVNNLSYSNGDHGIDVLRASGQRIVGNTIYDNVTAGINLEGGSSTGSTGGTLANNISVDNGLNSPRTRGNIRVDANSISGTTINFDIVFLNSAGTQIVWGNNSYSSLSVFRAATGQEARGIQADPQWQDVVARNFRLRPTSPAIDSANSSVSGQAATDLDGNNRLDDPNTPDTGSGIRSYDDRGAFEYQFVANGIPDAAADVGSTNEDDAVTIDILANDSDPDDDPLTPSLASLPSRGAAVITPANAIRYTPERDFNGIDSLTYSISDGKGGVDTAEVSLTVTPVNDNPEAGDDVAATRANVAVTISVLGNDSDVDGDALQLTSITSPGNGTAEERDGAIDYTPAAEFVGTDSFSYAVSDGLGGSDSALVTVTVSAGSPPTAVDDSVVAAEDTVATADVLANDSDPDGDPLTVTAVSDPAQGTASIEPSGSIEYVPAPDYHGFDSFTYTVSDVNGSSAVATVSVSIQPVNDPPSARDDNVLVPVDASAMIDVLSNDEDVDGDVISVSAVDSPQNGSVSIHPSGSLSYVANAGYSGPDAFAYTASDGRGGSDSATIDVTVDDPPSASLVITPSSGEVPLMVTADASGSSDTDAYGIASFSFDFGDGTRVGPQISPVASHNYTTSGTYTVTVTVTDEAGLSSTDSREVSTLVNLVGNPGFESGMTGWVGYPSGVMLARVEGGHSGVWSAKATNGTGGATGCTLNDSPNWVSTTQGGSYTASIWARADSPGAVLKLRLREYQGSTSLGSQSASVTLTTAWQRVSTTYVPAAPGSSTLDLNAYVSSAPVGTCFYADDLSVVRS